MVFRIEATGMGAGQADLSINKFIEATNKAAASDGRLYVGLTSDGFAAIDKMAAAKERSVIFTASQIKKMAEHFADAKDEISDTDSGKERVRQLRSVARKSDELGEHLSIGQKLVRLLGGRRHRARKLYKQVLAQEALVNEELRPANRMLNEIDLDGPQDWLSQLDHGARHLAQMVLGQRLAPSQFSDEQYAQVALDLLHFALPDKLREAGISGLVPETARYHYNDTLATIEIYREALHGREEMDALSQQGIDMVQTLIARAMLKLQENNHDREFTLEAGQLQEIAERPRELPESYLTQVLGKAVGQEDLTIEAFLREAQLAFDDESKQLYITRRGFEALSPAELAQRASPRRLTDEQVKELTQAYEEMLADDDLATHNQLLKIERGAQSIGTHLNPLQRLAAMFSSRERSSAEMVRHIASYESGLQARLKELSDTYAHMSLEEAVEAVKNSQGSQASSINNLVSPDFKVDEGDFRRAALLILRATLPEGEVRDALQTYDAYVSEQANMPAPTAEQMDILGTMIARVGQGLRRERRLRIDARQEVQARREAEAQAMEQEARETIAAAQRLRTEDRERRAQALNEAHEMIRLNHAEVLEDLEAVEGLEAVLDTAQEYGLQSSQYKTKRQELALFVLGLSVPEIPAPTGVPVVKVDEQTRQRRAVANAFSQIDRELTNHGRGAALSQAGVHAEFIQQQLARSSEAIDALVEASLQNLEASQAVDKPPQLSEAERLGELQTTSVNLIKQALAGVVLTEGGSVDRYYPMQSLLELYQVQEAAAQRSATDVTLEENCAKGLIEALYTMNDERFLQGSDVQQGLQTAFTEYMSRGRNLEQCSAQTRAVLGPMVDELTTWIMDLSPQQISEYSQPLY